MNNINTRLTSHQVQSILEEEIGLPTTISISRWVEKVSGNYPIIDISKASDEQIDIDWLEEYLNRYNEHKLLDPRSYDVDLNDYMYATDMLLRYLSVRIYGWLGKAHNAVYSFVICISDEALWVVDPFELTIEQYQYAMSCLQNRYDLRNRSVITL